MSMPRYAQDAIKNQGQGGWGNGFDPSMFGSGLGGFLGGMFGDSGRPYQDAADAYKKYFDQGTGAQMPFYNAGKGAIGDYQNWLSGMKDPSGFINNLMGNYQQSPWAKYQQQEAMRAATNMGSASGLTGSTPLMQQAQQNAGNISSQDMNGWLQNVLGINDRYGMGQQHMMDMGANSANSLSKMYGMAAGDMGKNAYQQGQAGQNDFWNMLMGGAQMGMGLMGL